MCARYIYCCLLCHAVTCTCTHIYIYIYIYVRVCAHIYIYIYIYIYGLSHRSSYSDNIATVLNHARVAKQTLADAWTCISRREERQQAGKQKKKGAEPSKTRSKAPWANAHGWGLTLVRQLHE